MPMTITNPPLGAPAAAIGQPPPAATANSSLSTEDQARLRPVTALSEPDPVEPQARILGPRVGPGTAPGSARDGTQSRNQSDTRASRTDSAQDQPDPPQDQFQLSAAAVDRLIESDPALQRLIRHEMASEAGTAEDAPIDQAAFRAKVIAYLKSVHADDPAFQRALKMGTIVVRQASDDSDPDLQPERTYTIYRSTALEAGAGQDDSIGKNDFIAWWPK